MLPLPIPATAQDSLRAATVTWRSQGRLHVTVVAKATFKLVAESRMTLVEPDPIVNREMPEPFGKGLAAGGDLAPYLGQAEVVLTGCAQVPPTFAQPTLRVQLGVVQRGALCVNKQLDLPIAARADRTLRIGGMGPISRTWPLRQRWLEGLDVRGLEARLMEIPDGLHWEYFQTAPQDQRFDRIGGDEWIVLGGMRLRPPRLRTQLPEVRAAARLFRTNEALPRQGEPVLLHADTVHVDMDRLRCSILWRGRVELTSEGELASLHVTTALERPGQPIAWSDPIEESYVLEEEDDDGELPEFGTIALSPEAAREATAAPATPFRPTPSVEPASSPTPHHAFLNAPMNETLIVSDDVRSYLAAQLATPFQPAEEAGSSIGGTLDLTPEQAREAARYGMPFDANHPSTLSFPTASSVASAPAPDALGGTFDMSPEGVRHAIAQPATPFEGHFPRGSTPPMAATPIPAAPMAPALAPSWVAPPAPPVQSIPVIAMVASPPVMMASEDDEDVGVLGAEFLAALAEA
jgi:hypothetical protein